MLKRIITIYTILSVALISVAAASVALAAKPDLARQVVNVNPSAGKAVVAIPAKAVRVAPGIFSLGTAQDVDGRVVEGYAIIKYKKGYGKPGTVCGNGVCEPGENAKKCPADCSGGGEEPDTSSCYGFLARDAKWKVLEPYLVNPANIRGLDQTFIASNMAVDIAKWETAAGVDILGDGATTGETLEADLVSPDNQNEMYFASIEEPGAIAITVVWGIFGGPPKNRQLVEWDQVYDQVDFDWSSSGEANKMDFANIATHELGHSVGLADLYTSECSEVTMYGYADYGEIKKRTLEDGDITGVRKLY